jgi:hypothetical protein
MSVHATKRDVTCVAEVWLSRSKDHFTYDWPRDFLVMCFDETYLQDLRRTFMYYQRTSNRTRSILPLRV